MNRISVFKGTHPAVMQGKIEKMDWRKKLQYAGKPNPNRELHKHETFKYRFVSILEKILNGGNQIFGFKNYELIRKD